MARHQAHVFFHADWGFIGEEAGMGRCEANAAYLSLDPEFDVTDRQT